MDVFGPMTTWSCSNKAKPQSKLLQAIFVTQVLMVIGYCAALATFPEYWWTCTLLFGLPFSYIAIQQPLVSFCFTSNHEVLHMLNLLWHTAWISFTVRHFSRTNSVLQSRAFLFVCSYDCLAQDLHRPRCHARRDLPSLRLPEVLDPSLCGTLLRYSDRVYA